MQHMVTKLCHNYKFTTGLCLFRFHSLSALCALFLPFSWRLCYSDLVVYNPTSKQLVLAMQVEPSINMSRFLKFKLSADVFYMVLHMLHTTDRAWNQIEMIKCNLTVAECEALLCMKPVSHIIRLSLSHTSLSFSVTCMLSRIITQWEVQELIIPDEYLQFSLVKIMKK